MNNERSNNRTPAIHRVKGSQQPQFLRGYSRTFWQEVMNSKRNGDEHCDDTFNANSVTIEVAAAGNHGVERRVESPRPQGIPPNHCDLETPGA